MENYSTFNEYLNAKPFVFSIPHSGIWIPNDMRKMLKKEAILSNTDWFLQELFDFLPTLDFTVIQNNVNRYVIDPNRVFKVETNSSDYRNNSVYQQNTFGHQLYDKSLDINIINERFTNFYQPYHSKLNELLLDKINHFGHVILIDLHSFAEYPDNQENYTADFVIGNNFDQSSSIDTRLKLADLLNQFNYSVSNNYPFAGGYITKHYGNKDGVEAIQLEIRYKKYIENRAFFEEEVTDYNPCLFKNIQSDLKKIVIKYTESISGGYES